MCNAFVNSTYVQLRSQSSVNEVLIWLEIACILVSDLVSLYFS